MQAKQQQAPIYSDESLLGCSVSIKFLAQTGHITDTTFPGNFIFLDFIIYDSINYV